MIRKLGMPAAGLAVALVAGVTAGTAVAAELKIASFVGSRHVINSQVLIPWSKEMADMSGGSLTVSMHAGGSLGKGPAKQFKRAIDGVADITWGLQGYTSKQFRRTTLIEFSSIGTSAVDSTKRLWKVYDQHLAPEYDRVKVLAIWTVDGPWIHTKSKRIETVADLAGLKIRTPSQAQAKLVAALGATPLAMPVTKLYNGLERGLIDGVVISPSAVNNFKLHEVTKYHTRGIPIGMSPFFAVMNKQAYEGLSPAHRALIDKTTGEQMSLKAAQVYDDDGVKGVETLEAAGHEIIDMSAAEVAKAVALLRKAEAEMLDEVEKEGVPARAVLSALRGAGS